MFNQFIRRPVFAIVISIMIVFIGILAIEKLPISQFPDIAPTTVNIFIAYPGASADVLVTVPMKNALLIPQKATFEVLEKKYVYVVDKDNKIRSREIEIEAELPHIFVVKSGLKADEKILLEGLRQVKENEKIHSTFVKPDSVISNLSLYAE